MSWRRFACAVAVSVTSSGISYADDVHDAIERSVIQQGFEASPIPKNKLNFAGKDPYLVGLGSYLVNAAGDCSGCHSFPRFLPLGDPAGSNPAFNDPYSGEPSDQRVRAQLRANFNTKHFLAGGRCFGGFMSRNLTPDATGRPVGLTEQEFVRVMRTGEDIACEKNPTDPICALGTPGANEDELQTMPWPTYHSMTDTDLRAIYAYLSAIPPADACNTVADGCPGFSGLAAAQKNYAYPNTLDCPNPPTPQ
jgi:mono/diheme cytochrome c family protein